MPDALGVLSPSVSLSAPAPAWPAEDPLAGEERKNSGEDAAPSWNLGFRGVACELGWDASEASAWSCSSGPGLLWGICELPAARALLLGVAEAELRCERRGVDIVTAHCKESQKQSGYTGRRRREVE